MLKILLVFAFLKIISSLSISFHHPLLFIRPSPFMHLLIPLISPFIANLIYNSFILAHLVVTMRLILVLVLSFFFVCAKRDSNQKFKACCARQKNADKECKRRFCDFRSIHQDNMKGDHYFLMVHFLNTCSPRGSTVKDMWDCASSRVDHTECCKEKKVLPICLHYCESNHLVQSDYLKDLVCLQNFNVIKQCFSDHLENNPNIFGDN